MEELEGDGEECIYSHYLISSGASANHISDDGAKVEATEIFIDYFELMASSSHVVSRMKGC